MASMSLQAAYDQARQSLESNDLDRAIGVAQHILDNYPDNLEAYRILGEAYLANRQLDRAQESFERVLRSDPENIPAHVGLGITHERQGKLDRAVAEFEQALEVKPDMAELRSQLLRLYTDAWGSENAQLRLSRAGLARLYAKGHMLPQAIAEFRQVIADQPGRFDAMVALAEALWRDGQEDEAMELCQDILAQRPESLKANLILGYLAMAAGRPEGERYWRAAEHMDPYHGVAQALFDTLPPGSAEEPTIDEWDEAAWRQRRAAEQQEQISATRPMEAVTPVGSPVTAPDFAGASWLDQTPTPPPIAPARPAAAAVNGDDFLASLLALDNPPPLPPSADVSDQDLDLGLDMAPFSLDDLDSESSQRPADTGQSLDAPGGRWDEASTTPTPAPAAASSASPEQEAADDEPMMTPFSLADLGLSDEEIAGLESIDQPLPGATGAEAPPQSPADDEPTMTPFSLADLGLSDDEIAGLESIDQPAGAGSPPKKSNAPQQQADDEPTMTPFSLADLGLSDEEIAGLESLQPDSGGRPALGASPPSRGDMSTAGAGDDIVDMNDLPIDLQPFSIDELDLSADSASKADVGGLPPALQPFSLEETPPPQRPRVSGFTAEENFESENLPDDEDFIPETRGYSWQQAPQKPTTGFVKSSGGEASGEEGSIFAKLKQRHRTEPQPQAPEPPPVTIGEDEHLGLFSLDDVSLRDDTESGATPAASAPPSDERPTPQAPEQPPAVVENLQEALASGEVQPFSLADLGLSEEEIAALGMGGETTPASAAPASPAEPEAPATPSAAPEEPPAEIENLQEALASGEVQPFSLADLGLSEEEIAALGMGGEAAPTAPEVSPSATPPVQPEAPRSMEEEAPLLTSDLQPFSLDDLDLSDEEIDVLGLGAVSEPDASSSLGLTEEELEGLDGGDLKWAKQPQQPAAQPSPSQPPEPDQQVISGDLVVDRLIALGRQQGFVDISDIIAGVEDPEAEAARIEEIGRLLHEANVEIRDGDEVIDMDAEYAEEDEFAGEPEEWPAAPETAEAQESSLTPYSLKDMGLSDDEIDRLGLADVDEPVAPSPPAAQAEEPAMTPFSLSELGLSDEEINALGLAEPQAETAPEPEAAAQAEEPAMTPFSLSELGLSDEEINALGLAEPQVETAPEPEAAAQAEEPAMTPFSLSELGLSDEEIDTLGLAEAPAQPDTSAMTHQEPSSVSAPPPADSAPPVEEDKLTRQAAEAPAPVAPAEPEPAPRALATPEPRRAGAQAEPAARADREVRPTRQPDTTQEAETASTGNDILDSYLGQIEAEPGNTILRLSVARASGQFGRADIAAQQYRLLIKRGELLDDVVEDLQDLISDIDDRQVLQRLHRVLGDAYSKQGRFREAVEEYSWRPGDSHRAR